MHMKTAVLAAICIFAWHDISYGGFRYGAAAQCAGEGYTEVTYTESSAPLLNPHRGWYYHASTETSSYRPLSASRLNLEREKDPTLNVALRMFRLDGHIDKTLEKEVLDLIKADFDAAREAGWTIMPRFAYTKNRTNRLDSSLEGPPFYDANKTIVLNHIESLGPILAQNEDIIVTLQAGFIGVYGEWYYTTYFGNAGEISESEQQDRKDVVDALLQVLPTSLSIALRTPEYKYMHWGSLSEPTTYQERSEGTDKSRIGHHNDCFLASDTDFGTYIDKSKTEYPYLEADTRYTPMTGEACKLNPPRSDCDTALSELSLFHWSVINREYNLEVLDSWKNGGCYDSINLSLGYRLVLISAMLPDTVVIGNDMCFEIVLKNVGYAAPIKEMDVAIVLNSTDTGSTYHLKVPNVDVRKWLPGTNHQITGPLPAAEIPPGTYEISLAIKNSVIPEDKRYYIVLANDEIVDSATRTNQLCHTIEFREASAEKTNKSVQQETKKCYCRKRRCCKILGRDNKCCQREKTWCEIPCR